ncbi:hypothetical protein [aff. Roholtiella sp. LEGE 12411]|uniref:hypothetical protein n=1 Tax=aff. Roholtiella sp. LEGE 12411 TaxID=1828822 RepID=UPI0018811D31|nr:hypothetical protein [aff. Roholtiella sp. LEGE 12411]MBE9037090.1 hypothetical protein [aff. Roholtiella sp. LEGE 12411]
MPISQLPPLHQQADWLDFKPAFLTNLRGRGAGGKNLLQFPPAQAHQRTSSQNITLQKLEVNRIDENALETLISGT